MKRTSFLLLAAAFAFGLVASCTNEDYTVHSEGDTPMALASDPHYVSYESALEKAISFLSNGDTTQTRANRFAVKNHYEYAPKRHTRSAGDSISSPTRFHIINFADNGGFAVAAADNRATPIYAYSEEGYLNIEDAIAHTGFAEFMEQADENFQYEIENNRGGIDTLSLDLVPYFHTDHLL